ncbi:MAG: hypothetical protein AAF488_12345, partial [Planctomycetota bacterium]
RGEYGGVSPARNLHFTTSEPSLGDEARIPPQLTEVGAKLRPEWFRRVLFDGAAVRPYMRTRMPQHGESNLRGLVDRLSKLDQVPPRELPMPPHKQQGEIRDAGRKLVGDEALNCVTCHNFNGKESQGFKGMDLISSYERLEPSWFYRFMVDPNSLRPNITMPNYWEDPDAIYEEILNGDRDSQIEALWYYLSLGRTAPDPRGIRSIASRLEVKSEARTYRGRSRVAGYRGIAVGFPGGLNYAFDANHGSLAALWTGGYVSVNWSGQGAGDFNPAGRAVELPRDVAFMKLADPTAPWPLRPAVTKEQPVNPDPTYPRQHGYRFRGYYFDEAMIPTFLYSSGGVDVEDRSAPAPSSGAPTLVRTLRFSSPDSTSLWFRVLAGRIERLGPRQFRLGRLEVLLPTEKATLRPFGPDGEFELLWKLSIPEGTSSETVRYELR